jgi:hypothetical protein
VIHEALFNGKWTLINQLILVKYRCVNFNATKTTTSPLSESNTQIVWGFSVGFPYPFNLMKLFFDMKEMIGADLDEGLQNLKILLEEN